MTNFDRIQPTKLSDVIMQRIEAMIVDGTLQAGESQFDLLEFRHALEGISAYYAAMRGTPLDLEQIKESFKAIQQDPGAEFAAQAQALTEFNLRIAEASHNVILLHLVRCMQPLLMKNILQNLQDLAHKSGVMQQLHEHRQQIVAAIEAGDPDQAREMCHQLLAFIEQALLTSNREQSRLQRSLRRTQTG